MTPGPMSGNAHARSLALGEPHPDPIAEAAIAEAAAEIAAAGRDFAARGWVPATSGNFSLRIDARRIAITASGRDKGALTADDIVVVDIEASLPAGVSAEAPLHASLYRRGAAIGAVLHVHSIAATLVSQRFEAAGEVVLEGYEMLKALSGIRTHEARVSLPVFANDQDIPALGRRVEARLGDAPGQVGYLIAGHGLYAWGRSMAEARRHVEAFDFLLTCELEKGRRFP
jgi:methylthioribulose-1-phosphate dehydratase